MKSLLLFGQRDARIIEKKIPNIGPNEILVRMKMCGICGTDVEKYQGNFSTPPILGHEPVGIIEKIGKDVSNFKIGDRVFVHHHVPCRVCYYCLRGDFTMCDSFTQVNLDPCGLSEFFRVPERIVNFGGVFKLNQNITDEKGIFIEPLACCIRAINKLNIQISDKILIIGVGPVGYLFLLLLQSMGIADIACADINQKRLDFANKLGCENTFNLKLENSIENIFKWSKYGPDLVIVSTSSVEALKNSIGIVRKGGKVCIFGNPKKGDMLTVEASKIFLNEIKIIPSYSTTEYEIAQAIYLLEKNIVKPEILITHKFKLDNAIDAIIEAEKGEAIKVIVYN